MTRWRDPYAAGWNDALEMLAAHCHRMEAAYSKRQESAGDEEGAAFLAGHEGAYWSLAAWARSTAKQEAEK